MKVHMAQSYRNGGEQISTAAREDGEGACV